MFMIKLNLGCGDDIRDGYLNFDKYPSDERVKTLDLTKLPLPFSNGSVDEILLNGVYEHLWVNHFEFISELSRILKIDGKLVIKVRTCNNNFDHEKYIYDRFYFDSSVKTYKLFSTVVCKGRLRGLASVYGEVKKFFSRIFFSEYIYEFKK